MSKEIERPYLGMDINNERLSKIMLKMSGNVAHVFLGVMSSITTGDDGMPVVTVDDESVEKLADELGMSQKVIWNSVEWLVDNEVLFLVRRNGHLLRNTYTFDSDLFVYVEPNALDENEHSVHEVYELADGESGHCRFIRYVNALATFNELSHEARYVLIELVSSMAHVDGRNVVVVDDSLKRRIMRRCGVGVVKCREAIASILKNRLFEAEDDNLFVGNKNVFGTQDWKSYEAIRAQFNYDTSVMKVNMTATLPDDD